MRASVTRRALSFFIDLLIALAAAGHAGRRARTCWRGWPPCWQRRQLQRGASMGHGFAGEQTLNGQPSPCSSPSVPALTRGTDARADAVAAGASCGLTRRPAALVPVRRALRAFCSCSSWAPVRGAVRGSGRAWRRGLHGSRRRTLCAAFAAGNSAGCSPWALAGRSWCALGRDARPCGRCVQRDAASVPFVMLNGHLEQHARHDERWRGAGTRAAAVCHGRGRGGSTRADRWRKRGNAPCRAHGPCGRSRGRRSAHLGARSLACRRAGR